MLVAEFAREPNDYVGIESSGVSEELPKVIVVGRLQLVLYDNRAVSAQVGRENIQGEPADIRFPLAQFELQAERCSQLRYVFG